MWAYLTAKITSIDSFAYDPEKSFNYDHRKQYATFYGGCMTVLYYSFVGTLYYL